MEQARRVLITIPVLIMLTWFVSSTKQGKAMRAVAQDTEASAMMGINVNRTISVAFALAGALAGAAGSSTCSSSTCATTPASSSA